MSESKQTLSEVRSVRNNNPGNLRAADAETQRRLSQPGYVLDKAIGFDKDGFAIFPDKETGMSAMQRQIGIDASRGMTGADMIRKYAPKADTTPLGQKYPNDPDVYISNVFGGAGLDPNKQIDSKDIPAIQQMMVKQEGGEDALAHFYGGPAGTVRTASTPEPSRVEKGAGVLASVAAPAALAAAVVAPIAKRKAPISTDSSQISGGGDSYDPGTLGQYRGRYPVISTDTKNTLKGLLAAKAERQQRKAEERRMRDERLARYRQTRAKLAENTIGFKDFRKKIYEQIILNDEKENQE